MGKASAWQVGLKAAVIPCSFLNRDDVGGCPSLFDGHATPGLSPERNRGSESPGQWPEIQAIWMDRLRFAHPTG